MTGDVWSWNEVGNIFTLGRYLRLESTVVGQLKSETIEMRVWVQGPRKTLVELSPSRDDFPEGPVRRATHTHTGTPPHKDVNNLRDPINYTNHFLIFILVIVKYKSSF